MTRRAALAVWIAVAAAAQSTGGDAAAEEGAAALERLRSCLDGRSADAGDPEKDPRGCLGAAVAACVAAGRPAIQCHQREERAWTALLEEAAATLEATLPGAAQDGAFLHEAEADLVAAQRARCADFGARVGAEAEASCLRDGAARRALALRALAASLGDLGF